MADFLIARAAFDERRACRDPTQAAPISGRELPIAFLDADRARISGTVAGECSTSLEAARDALAHVIPDGNLAPETAPG